MKMLVMTSVLSIASLVSACGVQTAKDDSVLQSASVELVETIVTDLEVRPTNGGINPEFRAVEIQGVVVTGGNACFAGGVTAELKQETIGDTVYVVPVLSQPQDLIDRVCTMEYNPVRKVVFTEVRFDTRVINRVVVKNVEQMGREVDADTFLDGIR